MTTATAIRKPRNRSRSGQCNRNTVRERFEALIGVEATQRMLEACGGILVYFRVGGYYSHPLPKDSYWEKVKVAVGEENYARLCEVFGGEKIYLPVAHAPYRGCVERAAHIREMAEDESMTVLEIAREMGCSQRWVNFVLNGK